MTIRSSMQIEGEQNTMIQIDKNQYVMTPFEIMKLEGALAIRARELTRSLAERNEIVVERSADEFDDALLAAERESSAQALSQDLRLLREIEAARDRLRNNTYGICLQCEEPITPQRLKAIPWAVNCLFCQAKLETDRISQQRLAPAA
jgi:DnaK suppressor protein